MGIDASGLQEAKVYYELRPGELDGLPPNLQHAARGDGALPNLTPIFSSIACGRQRGAQRLYFFHRGDLRLLDLEPLLHRLGIGKQLPSLLAAAGVVLGGRFMLPEGSVILGLRDTQKGIELKLDVLVPGVPDPPEQMTALLNLAMSDRPQSQRLLKQWLQAMTPDDEDSPGRISVVSFRVQPQLSTRCSLYIRPNGTRSRAGGRFRRAPHGRQRIRTACEVIMSEQLNRAEQRNVVDREVVKLLGRSAAFRQLPAQEQAAILRTRRKWST